MSDLSYDVKVWTVEVRRGSRGTVVSYRVRWSVAGKTWRRTFETRAHANAYRASLITAAGRGEAFVITAGTPLSATPPAGRTTWYEFTLDYTAMKWPALLPGSRRGVAEALTDATEVLVAGRGQPQRDELRAALRWAYSVRIRDNAEVPAELQDPCEWLANHSVQMTAFKEPATRSRLVRDILTRISQTKDGSKAASSTATRKRMILHNAMEYACEMGILSENPLDHIRWTRPRTASGVDPKIVINADQARRFLAAVESDGQRGRHLKAFFACMYYAALRPEEATELRRSNLTLPNETGQWGEMRLTEARPRSGSSWTNTGEVRERVPLKHRAEGDARRVPIHPDLVAILKAHVDEFGPIEIEGRIFVGAHDGPVTDRTYLRVFHRARAAAFTQEEAASSLMKVPYALRHAAVSTWLRTTGDAALVARWAGHSVPVLLKVYAKAVAGTEQETLDRIWKATRDGADAAPGHK